MSFFQEFINDISAIGHEFLDRFKNIPTAMEVVKEQLPTAIIGFVVVIVMLAIIAAAILVFSKIMAAIADKKPAEAASPAPAASAAAPVSQKTELVGVDEKTAAAIMAIVSKESGIPLNRLSFKSIKRTEDK